MTKKEKLELYNSIIRGKECLIARGHFGNSNINLNWSLIDSKLQLDKFETIMKVKEEDIKLMIDFVTSNLDYEREELWKAIDKWLLNNYDINTTYSLDYLISSIHTDKERIMNMVSANTAGMEIEDKNNLSLMLRKIWELVSCAYTYKEKNQLFNTLHKSFSLLEEDKIKEGFTNGKNEYHCYLILGIIIFTYKMYENSNDKFKDKKAMLFLENISNILDICNAVNGSDAMYRMLSLMLSRAICSMVPNYNPDNEEKDIECLFKIHHSIISVARKALEALFGKMVKESNVDFVDILKHNVGIKYSQYVRLSEKLLEQHENEK